MPKKTKRKDGRYRIAVYIGNDKYKYVYGATQKEVNQKADEVRLALGKGLDLTAENTTFKEWSDLWLQSVKRKHTASIYADYKYRIGVFCEYLGSADVAKIKLFQLQAVIDDLSVENPNTGKPTAKKTLIAYKGTVNQFFEYLIDNRIIDYNPAKNIELPCEAPQTERRALTSEEQQWVKEFPHRAQLPAMLAMLAGLRRGEITALLWSDIDFKNQTININKSYDFKNNKVKQPKTASGRRIVTMPDELSEYLQKQPKKALLVVVNKNNQPMTEPAWQRLWGYYMNALNRTYGDLSFWKPTKKNKKPPMVIEEFMLHCLRHTYATLLYDAGVDVLTAKKLLGHSDVKTTLGIYTHLSAENEKINLEKLNKFLSKKSECGSDVGQNEKKKG